MNKASAIRLAKRHQDLKAQGLCPSCGAEPVSGKIYCYDHLRYFRVSVKEKRKRRQAAGLCVTCGEKSTSRTCLPCRDKSNAQKRGLRLKRLEEGNCPACGHPQDQETKLCGLCREKISGRAAAR